MKLTKREKILLAVLCLCAALALLYYAVINPQLSMLRKLEDKAGEFSQALESVKLRANTENPVFKEYKITNAKAHDLLQGYYPSIIQENILLMLDSKIKASGLQVDSMSFTEPALLQLEEDNETDAQDQSYELKELADQISGGSDTAPRAENKEAKETVPVAVENMTVLVSFQSTYSQFYDFVKAVEQENKSIAISNVKITSSSSGTIAGEIILDVYAMAKPFSQEQDKEYLNWSIYGEYGTSSPFGYIPGYNEVGSAASALPSIPELSSKALEMKDFFITIRPVTSDLPTLTIGKFDDLDRATYLYADNAAYEDIELQIIQDKDKYYYGYKTKDYSYPSGYSKKMIEFSPAGDELRVLVISCERNKEKDVNGANLTVINKTDLPLKVFVRNDDAVLPRLKIDKLQGNTSIVKE